ncbi:MAG: response regulator [Methylococcales bacterium]|nr:response regulator [Methylococcales bacterium]
MKIKRFKRGIRWKLLSTMVSLVISLLVIITYIQIKFQTNFLQDELEARTQLMKDHLTLRANTVSESLSAHVEEGLSLYNFVEISHLLKKRVNSDKDLNYAILMSMSRKAFTHTLKPELEGDVLNTEAALFAVKQQTVSEYEYQRQQIKILEIILPIQFSTSQWGVLRLGFSLESLQQKINESKQKNTLLIEEMMIQSLLISTIFLLFSSLIIIMLSTRFSRPISDLTKAASRLAAGNFSVAENLNFKTGDEIEILADVFVEMSKNLKDSYEKLENYNHDLEEQVDKRTLELEEVRDQALNASKAKTEFLATVSHEIRNPMHAIINTTQLMLKTQLVSKQRNHLNNIVTISNTLVYLINDLLDVAKIEAGKLEIEAIKVNLKNVLDDISNLTLVKAEKKSIGLRFSLEKDIPLCLIGDPLRLTQILLNLVTNAIKFTTTGDVLVSITLLAAESNKVRLKFCVADTGVGLSPEQLSRLFQSFSQADETIARTHGGTGLGLVISKQLVEMMGGQIQVSSELGKGSQFYFELDLNYEPELISGDYVLPEALKDLKILAVDDDVISRTVLQTYLESFGFEVDSVESGEQALSLLKTSPTSSYGLILMDWEMPGLDGIETSKRIKASENVIPIPTIIMVTSHCRDDVLSKVNQGDIDALLIKPVEPTDLLENIARVLYVNLPASSQSALSLDGSENVLMRGIKILVVDDDDINRLIAKEMLEDEGLIVDLAEGGQQALDKINQQPFDLVLMDLQMPEMDGYETCRQIRRNLKYQDLPIIALTAHAMSDIKDKCLHAGMNDYASKPFKMNELLSIFARWVQPQIEKEPANVFEPVISQPTSVQQEFSNLSGIDVELALDRLGGKESIFRKLLLSFEADFTDITNKINEAFCLKDEETASRLVHSLKGVSGNLSAYKLYEKSQKLEDAINNQENCFEALSECDMALKELLVSIEQLPKK